MSNGSTMSTVFGTVAVVVFIFLAAIAASTAVAVSNKLLSLGSGTLVTRPFLFAIETVLITALF